MATGIMDFFGRMLRKPAKPMSWDGAPGFSIYGGLVDTKERDKQLASHDERHRTYGSLLRNTSIVAASVRYYLNLVAKSEWSFEPSEADTTGEYAEKLEEILTSDPRTPWHRIVRRSAMYRFYGFSVQEWRAKRREDGTITFADIRPRPQATIERWDVDEEGEVIGMVQTRPQDRQYLYIPRSKALYIVDDSLDDSPEGLGLFRHMVSPAERLSRYEQLEGFGYRARPAECANRPGSFGGARNSGQRWRHDAQTGRCAGWGHQKLRHQPCQKPRARHGPG